MRKWSIHLVLLATLGVFSGSANAAYKEEYEEFEKGSVAYNKGDIATAINNWKAVALKGNLMAQLHLGQMYQMGDGGLVPINLEEAAFWFRKAAEQGDESGQCFLAFMYKMGNGVPKDPALAMYWFQKSAEQGSALAQRELVKIYMNGTGTPVDYTLALEWLRRVGMNQDDEAQVLVGQMYLEGKGTPKNIAEAVRWFCLAAEMRNGKAYYFLGRLYEQGEGVEKDDLLAYVFYRLAVNRNYFDAAVYRDAVAARLAPEQLKQGQKVIEDSHDGILFSVVLHRAK